jgi:hypothetical protein
MNQQRKQSTHNFYFLLPVFSGLGVGLGALISNIGVGLAIGAGIGTLASLLVWQWEEHKR